MVQPQYTDAQLKAVVTDEVLKALDGGTATKPSGPPSIVRGRRPVVENIPHPSPNTRAIAFVADGNIYISRASPAAGTGLVGWYKIGKLPPPQG